MMASGIFLAGGDDAVGHDQAALGVGVEDLDGLAAEHGQDVGGALGGAGGHVLGDAEPGGRLDGKELQEAPVRDEQGPGPVQEP